MWRSSLNYVTLFLGHLVYNHCFFAIDSKQYICKAQTHHELNLSSNHHKMPLPVITTEKPSTSETREAPKDTQITSQTSTSAQGQKSEAELAAEKLYEERMEDEYAKREGGA
jgi:hypothetical protein